MPPDGSAGRHRQPPAIGLIGEAPQQANPLIQNAEGRLHAVARARLGRFIKCRRFHKRLSVIQLAPPADDTDRGGFFLNQGDLSAEF